MTVTPASFVASFPMFGNEAVYPTAEITALLAEAYLLLNPYAWRDVLDTGVGYYVAHYLVLNARDNKAAAMGGIPGEMNGPTSSKSLRGASKSYDTGAAGLNNAGQWALTRFGARFLQLSRLAGAGGVYVTGPGYC